MAVSPPFEEASETMPVLSIVALQSLFLPHAVLEVQAIDMLKYTPHCRQVWQ